MKDERREETEKRQRRDRNKRQREETEKRRRRRKSAQEERLVTRDLQNQNHYSITGHMHLAICTILLAGVCSVCSAENSFLFFFFFYGIDWAGRL
jgi:hypothetical protein